MIRTIQISFPKGDRKNNYAGTINFVRKAKLSTAGFANSSLVVIGERRYSANGEYREPSDRWDQQAGIHTQFNDVNGDRKVVALGVARSPGQDGSFSVKFVQIGEKEDWEKFKKTHKVLLLGVYFKQNA